MSQSPLQLVPQLFSSSVSHPPFYLLSQSQFTSLLQSIAQLPSQSPSQTSPLLPSQSASHSPCQLYSLSFWLSTSQTPFQLLSQSALQWTFQSTAVASSPSGSIKLRSTPSLPLWSLSSTLFSLSQSPSLSMSQSPFSQSPKSWSQLSSLQSPLDLPSSALLPSQSLLPPTPSSPLQSKMIKKLVCILFLFCFCFVCLFFF